MIANPIFIIGTERSGSNLLRLMLNAHPRIAVPHPPHVLRDMAPFQNCYGDLSQDRRFRLMAEDMALLVNTHFAPWPFKIDARELALSAQVRSLYGLYAALYELYMKRENKARWGCKSTFMYRHIAEIRANHSAPRFLHLVRDPRDVAASAQQSIFSRYHPYCQAKLWNEQQAEVEKLAGADILRIRYEDLVNRPEEQLIRVMSFVGEDYLPEQLQFFRGPEATKLSALSQSWKNCAIPVSATSVGQFRKRLKKDEIAWVEHETRDLMKKYGYTPDGRIDPRGPGLLQRVTITFSEHLRMIITELKSLFQDKNFGLRWKKWFLIQYLKFIRSMDYGWSAGKNENVREPKEGLF